MSSSSRPTGPVDISPAAAAAARSAPDDAVKAPSSDMKHSIQASPVDDLVKSFAKAKNDLIQKITTQKVFQRSKEEKDKLVADVKNNPEMAALQQQYKQKADAHKQATREIKSALKAAKEASKETRETAEKTVQEKQEIAGQCYQEWYVALIALADRKESGVIDREEKARENILQAKGDLGLRMRDNLPRRYMSNAMDSLAYYDYVFRAKNDRIGFNHLAYAPPKYPAPGVIEIDFVAIKTSLQKHAQENNLPFDEGQLQQATVQTILAAIKNNHVIETLLLRVKNLDQLNPSAYAAFIDGLDTLPNFHDLELWNEATGQYKTLLNDHQRALVQKDEKTAETLPQDMADVDSRLADPDLQGPKKDRTQSEKFTYMAEEARAKLHKESAVYSKLATNELRRRVYEISNRNEMLKAYNIARDEKNLWQALIKAWVNEGYESTQPQTYSDGTYVSDSPNAFRYYKHSGQKSFGSYADRRQTNLYMLNMGEQFFEEFVKFLSENPHIWANNDTFPSEFKMNFRSLARPSALDFSREYIYVSEVDEAVANLPKITVKQIQLLEKTIQADRFPFVDITLDGISFDDESFQALKTFIRSTHGKINSLTICTPEEPLAPAVQNRFSQIQLEQLEDLIQLVRSERITTRVQCRSTSEYTSEYVETKDPAHNRLQMAHLALENAVAYNRREAKKQARLEKRPPAEKKHIDVKVAPRAGAKTSISKLREEAKKNAKSQYLATDIQEQEEEEQQASVEQAVQGQREQREQQRENELTIAKENLVTRERFTKDQRFSTLLFKVRKDIEILPKALHKVRKDDWDAKIPPNPVELAKLWEDVTGNTAGDNTFPHQIKYFDEAAANEIVKHWYCFSGGLNPNNLPKGFFLQRTPEGDRVLCFSPIAERQVPPTDMTMKLRTISCQETWFGDEEQFGEREKNAPSLNSFLRALYHPQESKISSFTIGDRFRQYMEKEDPKRGSDLQLLLLNESGDIQNLQALWPILYKEGCVGLRAIFDQLKDIDSKVPDFKNFKECFLRRLPPDWSFILEKEFNAAVNKIAHLTPNEKFWWNTLTAAQRKNNPTSQQWANLSDQVNAFEHFCKEYKALTGNHDLPLTCDVEVNSLQLGLENLLSILNTSQDRNEQVNHLKGLDLTSLGAVYATENDNYHLVTEEMQLTPANALTDYQKTLQKKAVVEVKAVASAAASVSASPSPSTQPAPLNYRVNFELLRQAATDDKCSYNDMETLFYRQLGQKTHIRSIASYRALLSTFVPADAELNKLLLTILTFSTTGPRGCFGNLTKETASFKEAITALSKNMGGDAKENGRQILTRLLDFNTLVPPVTLKELALNLQTVANAKMKMDSKATDELLEKLFQRAHTYGTPWLRALEIRKQNPTQTDFNQFDTRFVTFAKQAEQEVKGIQPKTIGNVAALLASLQQIPTEPTLTKSELVLNLVPGTLAPGTTIRDAIQKANETADTITAIEQARAREKNSTWLEITRLLIKFAKEHNVALNHALNILASVNMDAARADNQLLTEAQLLALLKNLDVHFDALELYDEKSMSDENYNAIFHIIKESLPEYPLSGAPVSAASASPFRIGMNIRNFLDGKAQPDDKFDAELFALQYREEIATRANSALQVDDKSLKDEVRESLAKSADLTAQFICSRLIADFNPAQDIKEMLSERRQEFKQVTALTDSIHTIHRRSPQDSKKVIEAMAKSAVPGTLLKLQPFSNTLKTLTTHSRPFPHQLLNLLLLNDRPDLLKKLDEPTQWTRIAALLPDILTLPISLSQKEALLDVTLSWEAEKQPAANSPYALLKQCAQNYPPCVDQLASLAKAAFVPPARLQETLALTDLVFTLLDKIDADNPTSSFRARVAERFFARFATNPDRYNAVVNALLCAASADDKKHDVKGEADPTSKQLFLIQIIVGLGPVAGLEEIFPQLLQQQSDTLELLARLCQSTKPPSLSELQTALNDSRVPFKSFLEAKETAQRNALASNDMSRVPAALNRMVHLTGDVANTVISLARQNQLNSWIQLVDAYGTSRDYPLHYRNGIQPCAAKDLTREEINQLVKKYRAVFQNPAASPRDKNAARLAFIALAREVMYRTTGKLLNSTQLLAALNAISQGGSSISQIPTGQGKTLVTALYASILWLEGNTVDICTSNMALAQTAFNELSGFYSSLGITANVIHSTSDMSAYHPGGVHITDVANLALFRSKKELEKQHGPINQKTSLVLDEADFTTLDDKTDYRFAVSFDKSSGAESPLKEVYQFLNQFIDEKDAHVEGAREYLLKQKLTEIQRSRLVPGARSDIAIDDDQLDTWVHSATAARELQSPRDYKIEKEKRIINGEEKEISVARIIDKARSRVSRNAQWSNGVQQFLHVRLQLENPGETFLIDQEVAAVSAVSSPEFVKYYHQVWGMTGTAGSPAEIAEQQAKYGFSMTVIPPYQDSRRNDRPAIIAKDDKDQEKIIVKELKDHLHQLARALISRDHKPQPMLIICHDAEESKNMYNIIKEALKHEMPPNGDCKGIQLYNASETLPDAGISEDQVIERAGLAGMITISTSMLGRGTDIQPNMGLADIDTKHPDGLFVMPTNVNSQRAYEQIIGRAGRQGDPGETVMIVQDKELLPREEKETDEKRIERTRVAIAKQEAKIRTEREPSRAVTYYFQTLFNQFMQLLADTRNAPQLKKECQKKWARCRIDIELAWSRLQSKTPPLTPTEKWNRIIRVATQQWQSLVGSMTNHLRGENLVIPAQLSAIDTDSVEKALKQNPREVEYLTYRSSTQSAPLLKTDLHKIYYDLTPPDTKPKGAPADAREQYSHESWNAMLKNVLQELRAYEKRWSIASDRRSNIRELISNIESLSQQASNTKTQAVSGTMYSLLLKAINAASTQALKDDIAVDKNAFFKKRNSNGSRYQSVLMTARREILSLGVSNTFDKVLLMKTEVKNVTDVIDNLFTRLSEIKTFGNYDDLRGCLIAAKRKLDKEDSLGKRHALIKQLSSTLTHPPQSTINPKDYDIVHLHRLLLDNIEHLDTFVKKAKELNDMPSASSAREGKQSKESFRVQSNSPSTAASPLSTAASPLGSGPADVVVPIEPDPSGSDTKHGPAKHSPGHGIKHGPGHK
jgi:hypothetical protein